MTRSYLSESTSIRFIILQTENKMTSNLFKTREFSKANSDKNMTQI